MMTCSREKLLKKKFPQTEIQCPNAGEKIAKKWRLRNMLHDLIFYISHLCEISHKRKAGVVLGVLVFSITTIVPSAVLVPPSWLLLP